MYNTQLEELIDVALADGVLTEKEKRVLFKKAESMGIDLDEFDMVLEARLIKLKKKESENIDGSATKKTAKYGEVKKCPSCGALVQSFQGVCSECGYAFESIDANLSSKKLSDKIEEILNEEAKKRDTAMAGLLGTFGFGQMRAEEAQEVSHKRIKEAIVNFPIPNTKADLIEFIVSMKLKSQSGEYSSAYFAKYSECIEKAKILFPNDKDLSPLVADFSKKGELKRKWSSMSKRNKTLIIAVVLCIVIPVVCFKLMECLLETL